MPVRDFSVLGLSDAMGDRAFPGVASGGILPVSLTGSSFCCSLRLK